MFPRKPGGVISSVLGLVSPYLEPSDLEERSATFSWLTPMSHATLDLSASCQPTTALRSPRLDSIPGFQANELGLAVQSLERRQKANGEDGAARLRREIQDSEANLQRRMEEVLYAIREEGVLAGCGRDDIVAVDKKSETQTDKDVFDLWIHCPIECLPGQDIDFCNGSQTLWRSRMKDTTLAFRSHHSSVQVRASNLRRIDEISRDVVREREGRLNGHAEVREASKL